MVGVDRVRANFERYGLLDDRVRFLEGWFADTLPAAPIEQLAVLRLDGDLYESTMDALVPLYDKVSPRRVRHRRRLRRLGAVPHGRATTSATSHGITDEIVEVDWTGVCWRKS